MSESEVVSKVSRRSRLEADRLVLEFERSGMTRTAFCRTHGVSAHTLDYCRMRRGKKDGTARLVPVELVAGCGGDSAAGPSHHAQLRVELRNGRQIVVEEGFSTALLKSVVAALEA
jgi:transposase